jgi:hypothetical protein
VSAVFRWVNWAMVPLFLLAVVVQWNDPDPLRWMAIYGAAFVVCLVVAVRGHVAAAVPALLAVIAFAWALATMAGGMPPVEYFHMFDAWEMKSAPVEAAREASGLLIVAAWMAAVAARQRGRLRAIR